MFLLANNPWTEVLPSYQRLNEEDRAQLSESLGTFDRLNLFVELRIPIRELTNPTKREEENHRLKYA